MADCLVFINYGHYLGRMRAYSVFSFKKIGNETQDSIPELSDLSFGTAKMCKEAYFWQRKSLA